MFKKHTCDKIILMKKLMILFSLFFLFITSSVFAECINGNCVNGYGVYEIDDGNISSMSKKNLIIEKRGLANKLELLLTQQSFFYVLILIIFSIIFSLLSNLIFRKK